MWLAPKPSPLRGATGASARDQEGKRAIMSGLRQFRGEHAGDAPAGTAPDRAIPVESVIRLWRSAGYAAGCRIRAAAPGTLPSGSALLRRFPQLPYPDVAIAHRLPMILQPERHLGRRPRLVWRTFHVTGRPRQRHVILGEHAIKEQRHCGRRVQLRAGEPRSMGHDVISL